jgi:hypothetical protein
VTAVFAPAGAYRAAVAELPLSARLADAPSGAIVVVPGGPGWVDGASAAVSAGAVAVLVAGVGFESSADLRRLAEAGIPIIIERPLLRTDAAADAVAARTAASSEMSPRIIVAEAAASRARLAAAMQDAVGWLRILAGETPTLVAADQGLVLLEASAGISATLTSVATGRPGAGRIRVQALGEVITDVEVEGRATYVTTASAAGRLIAPQRFESSERLALRRALEAVAGHTVPADLDDLLADAALVERLLLAGDEGTQVAGIDTADSRHRR